MVALIVYSVVLLIVIQLLSLLVYSYSNGDPKRKNTVRAVLYVYLGLMVLTALAVFQKNGGGIAGNFTRQSLRRTLEYFPVIGWTQGAVFGVINGDMRAAVDLHGADGRVVCASACAVPQKRRRLL